MLHRKPFRSAISLSVLPLALLFVPATYGQFKLGEELPSGIKTKIDSIEKRLDELEAANRTDEAQVLRESFREIMSYLKGNAAFPDDGVNQNVELHVVGVGEGRQDTDQTATVRVTYTDKPVVLALCGQAPLWWTVEAADGVEINKIIVGGQVYQDVEAAPDGVPVEKHVREDGDRNYFSYVPDPSSEPALRMVDVLRELTGLPVASYTSVRRAGPAIIVDGTADFVWRVRRSEELIERLYEMAVAERRAEYAGRFADIQFPGVYARSFVNIPVWHESSAGLYGFSYRFAGMLTLTGPVTDSLRPMNVSFSGLAMVSGSTTAYGVNPRGLVELDLETGVSTEHEFQLAGQALRSPRLSDVAYDAKRRRLIVLGAEGRGSYTFDLASGVWSRFRMSIPQDRESEGRRMPIPASIAFHPGEDRIYVTVIDRLRGENDIGQLYRFDAEGKALGSIELTEPVSTGRYGGGMSQFTQLEDDFFVIVIPPSGPYPNQPEVSLAKSYVVNVKTGEVVYSTSFTQ